MGVLVVAVVVGVGAWAATLRDGSTPEVPSAVTVPGRATTGSRAPDFELTTFDGKTFRMSQQRGRPVLVNFWASWCRPCRKEFPLFGEVYERYRARGLVIAGVAYRDITADARRFARAENATWTLMSDSSDLGVARAYGVRAIPQTFFVDRDGRIVERVFGIPSAARFDALVRRIVGS